MKRKSDKRRPNGKHLEKGGLDWTIKVAGSKAQAQIN
jgi:hypothetical protein